MGDIQADLSDSDIEGNNSKNKSENSILDSDSYEDKGKKKKKIKFVPTQEELDWVH